MRRDKTKAALSIIATLTSAVLILVYWLFPANANSHRLHILLIDCIPDIVVVLIAMPVVYWLLYRRGLTNMGDCPLFSPDSGMSVAPVLPHLCRHAPPCPPEQTTTAAPDGHELTGRGDLLLVMDVADDFVAGSREGGSALEAVNAAVRTAESRAMPVVFARARPPSPHGRRSETQRVLSVGGSEPSREIYTPAGSTVVDLEAPSGRRGGRSALENPVLNLIVSHPAVRRVYIAGGVLEHSVQATCRDILQRGKQAIALQAAIFSAGDNAEDAEKTWRGLVAEGLTRADHLNGRNNKSP